MEVLHLNKVSFAKLIAQKEKPVLVDFWAEWCGPCRMLAPVLEELAAAHPELVVGKINVDQELELAQSLEIDSIPALFFYRNGALEKRLVGCMDKETLEARLGL